MQMMMQSARKFYCFARFTSAPHSALLYNESLLLLPSNAFPTLLLIMKILVIMIKYEFIKQMQSYYLLPQCAELEITHLNSSSAPLAMQACSEFLMVKKWKKKKRGSTLNHPQANPSREGANRVKTPPPVSPTVPSSVGETAGGSLITS